MKLLRFQGALSAALMMAFLAAGCGSSRTLPTGSASAVDPGADTDASIFAGPGSNPAPGLGLAQFYPLAPGNRWHYQNQFATHVVAPDGSTIGSDVSTSEIEHEQTHYVTLNGRNYLNEMVQETSENQATIAWAIPLRQDARGLYEADQTFELSERAPAGDPATKLASVWNRAISAETDPVRRAAFERASAIVSARLEAIRASVLPVTARSIPRFRPPGAAPDPGELRRLRYPLVPGQNWIILDSPRFEARVEAFETLELPAGRFTGWRIRYDNQFMGPHDRVYVWYGRSGFLRLALHAEAEATDTGGNPVGTVYADQLQSLDALSLVGQSPGTPIVAK